MGPSALTITSPAFADGSTIPDQYTCRGANTSPPLTITGVPVGAASLALIMHDPDAPGGDFLHWSLWNISPDLNSLPAGEIPDGALQGKTSFGTIKYGGPCPPTGVHRYIFILYVLDAKLNTLPGANEREVLRAIDDHAVTHATLTGLFGNVAE